MKINESQRLSSVQAYRGGAPSKEDRTQVGAKGARKDNIQISPEAKELLAAQRMNDSNRAERIEQLKEAVRTGTYEVSADRLAETLLPYLK